MSLFSKALDSAECARLIQVESARLAELDARETAFRTEENTVLEEGDREKLGKFRSRTANLAQELADDRSMLRARLARLVREHTAVLAREEQARRQEVVERLAASYKAIPPLLAKWNKDVTALVETLVAVDGLFDEADRTRLELERFDELDKAAGQVDGPSWLQRGDAAADTQFLVELDANGNRPHRPTYTDLELCDSGGRRLWSKHGGAR